MSRHELRLFLPLPGSRNSFPAAGHAPVGRFARRSGGLLLLGLSGLLTACTMAVESGPPIANPGEVASVLRRSADRNRPTLLRFEWKYADRRGGVGGEGVARFNPPDSLRVDLFTSGDVAMALALAGGELRSLGEIEDVEIPDLPFVYAMAGLFAPGAGRPEAYASGTDSVLVYAGDGSARTYYYVRQGRLRRVEQRVHGRTVQRVNVEWGAAHAWPSKAEYRDLSERNRVRWEMSEVTTQGESHPARVFDLPPVP